MALLQVKTENGIIEGLPAGNQSVSIFKGIPFAKPPVGDLRWKAPQPAEDWDGVLLCHQFAPIPMQARFASEGGGNTLAAQEFYVIDFPMSEDCLYLNVWTPAKSDSEKLPVAVYIHGGGMETGYSYLNAYDGEAFAKRGVIMVTIAYRLGIFGFMAHPDLAAEDPHHSTGNYAIMDQVAALAWIHRNIAAFGGDPENVTIFGQSAGGMSVQNLCGTPLANGLYQHAIMQSGGGLSKGGPLDEFSLEKAYECSGKYLAYAGIDSPVNARNRDAKELIDLFVEFKGDKGYSGMFQPCVDGYVHPLPMAEYFMKGMQPDIDYMIGCTRDEMRRFGAPAPAYEQIRATAEDAYGEKAAQFLEAVHADDPKICARYFEDPIGSNMLSGDLAWCENQLILGRKPAYEYYFTYVPPGAEAMGAHHSVEHHYVFQTLVRSKRPYTGFDFDLSNKLCDYWTNFCKTGNPNGDGEETWAPFTKEHPEALIIDGPCHMGKVVREPQIAFHVDYTLNRL